MLMEFIEDNDLCILNGRFGDMSNHFTSVSYRGSAVVDHCLTSVDNIALIDNFSVLACT